MKRNLYLNCINNYNNINNNVNRNNIINFPSKNNENYTIDNLAKNFKDFNYCNCNDKNNTSKNQKNVNHNGQIIDFSIELTHDFTDLEKNNFLDSINNDYKSKIISFLIISQILVVIFLLNINFKDFILFKNLNFITLSVLLYITIYNLIKNIYIYNLINNINDKNNNNNNNKYIKDLKLYKAIVFDKDCFGNIYLVKDMDKDTIKIKVNEDIYNNIRIFDSIIIANINIKNIKNNRIKTNKFLYFPYI